MLSKFCDIGNKRFRRITLTAFALALAAGGAKAQQSTSATYDAWILQCQDDTAGSSHKTCEISQVSRLKDSNAPFSRLFAGRPAAGKPVMVTAQVPVNVSTRETMSLKADEADAGIMAPVTKCVPGGCFADFELKDEFLKKLRTAEGVGKLTFKDASGRDIAIPISFKGFRAAFDALGKDKVVEKE